MGGSPCTHWSIAQTADRETMPSGVGWELFKNFLIAKERWKPDYFLYENNKSASRAIKDQIALALNVGIDGTEFNYINSSLVSAQNRQRFYVTNFGRITQPRDRKIYLEDILEPTATQLVDTYKLKLDHQTDRYSANHQKHQSIKIGEIENNGKYLNGKQVSQQYRVSPPPLWKERLRRC